MKGLEQRIRKLEQAIAPIVDRCDLCGGPEPQTVILTLEELALIRECPDLSCPKCGRHTTRLLLPDNNRPLLRPDGTRKSGLTHRAWIRQILERAGLAKHMTR
jgi:hypothetical protein